MSQLRIFALVALLAMTNQSTAYAFEDAQVLKATAALEQSLQSESNPIRRIQSLERFKKILFNYLQKAPVGTSEKEKEAFADLNEFYLSVAAIRLNSKSLKKDCHSSRDQIEEIGEMGSGNLTEPTAKAMGLLKKTCRQAL